MVNTSVLVTDSGVNSFSGGGIVSLNIAESLQSTTVLKYILSTQKFPEDTVIGVPSYSINPRDYGYTEPDWKTTPFLLDYIAFHLLHNENTDIAMTYGCPFGITIEELKRDFKTKVICDLAPHDISVSKDEHIKHTGKYPYPHLNDEMLWGLYSRHLRFADMVVTHSKRSALYMRDKARLKNDPVVIPHGCYLPDEIPSFPDVFTPSYFGAIGFDKGTGYLLKAWESCPYNESFLLIGGRGFQIEHPKVKSLGYIENLVDFYKQTSIYIQPSVIEGFGLTPLEAMAHGRPVIVAEGAGMSELITDGKDGFVVPIRDIEAIKNKIIYLHDNPSEIMRMGAEARKTSEKYTWSIIKEEYKKIIREL